jgi:hypothetical protein
MRPADVESTCFILSCFQESSISGELAGGVGDREVRSAILDSSPTAGSDIRFVEVAHVFNRVRIEHLLIGVDAAVRVITVDGLFEVLGRKGAG